MNEENSTSEPVAPELDAANEKSSISEPVEPEQEPDAVNEDDLAEPVEPEQDAQDIDATPTQADEPKAAAAGGAWSMPKPVFKKTSGYLPQGFEKQFTPAPQGNEDVTAEQTKPEFAQPSAAAPEPAELAAVEPQPDVIEDGSLESAIVAPPSAPQKKGVVGRILMILLALIIIGLMAAVLVAAVWFVLWPRPEGTIN